MNNDRKGLRKFAHDFRRFFPLLLNLASRDIKVKYRRSVLGILWSVLNPLLTMLVLTQVFGLLLKVKVENFATYYIVASSLWNFFSESTSLAMTSVLTAAPLIKKVYIPKYIFPLEKCLFALINFAFSLIAVVLVMLCQRVWPTRTILLAPLPVLYCFVFCVGFSLILSALTVYFRDIMHLYSVLLTVWLYLTPVIYPESLVEGHRLVRAVVRCNPMYHFVKYFRDVMMYGRVPPFRENLICITIALVTLTAGGLIFAKAQKKFILHI